MLQSAGGAFLDAAELAAQAEIDGLVRSGTSRLKDAQTESLSLDGWFDLAYNAAHAFSLAAHRWHGYRSEDRFTVFQCLERTVKMPPQQWRVLDQAHRKRNFAEYEGDLDVDRKLVEAIIRGLRMTWRLAWRRWDHCQPGMDRGSSEMAWVRSVNHDVRALRREVARAEKCPILGGAISGNQDLKCPYLAEILDTAAAGFLIISAT